MSLVMVVDDKEMMRDSVGSTLRRAGFDVVAANGGAEAIRLAADRRPDAIVTDLKMPGMTGIDLLEKLREIDDELPVILMTAFGAIETAVQAIRLGAFDYITKPFEGDELVIAVKRAIRHGMVVRENAVLRAATPEREVAGIDEIEPSGVDRIIGQSPAIRRVKEQVLSVASSHGTVLVCGESGTGKEVISRAIHDMSPRTGEPFLAVNCAALSESLLESELFGHERGAFTGADKMRKGRFELADRGTLLLDEVSEVGQKIQAKLLRVLQERAFERVGSSTTMGVDVRVIATSNRDLPAEVASGEFRQDLFFRLNVLPIHLPSLRDRPEDIEPLAEHFTRKIAARDGRDPVIFEPDAMGLLRSYRWPGNVRELQNVCERAAVLCEQTPDRGPVVTRSLLEPWLIHNHGSRPMAAFGLPASQVEASPVVAVSNGSGEVRTLEEIEREAIIAALRRFDGHRQKTARSLGIGVRTLGLKLKKWKEMSLVEATL